MGRATAALLWLTTRAILVWLLLGPEEWVSGDIAYFAQSLDGLSATGLARTLVEYPVPGVGVVAFPWLLAKLAGSPALYPDMVMALAVLADAAFLVMLDRMGGPRRSAAVGMWLLGVPLLGATAYARFDLVPGVLAGMGLLFLARWPRFAAGCAAVGAAVKLWPLLLVPAMAARSQERRPVLVTVALTGAVLGAASLVLAGWSRLVSPLTWQAGRGLQIESVLATPAMAAWVKSPTVVTVGYTAHNAYEVSGPGVAALVAAADILSVVLVVGLLVLWWRAWLRGDALSREAVAWLCLAAVTGFVVTNKVLSPQYFLWLLPVAAAALASAGSVRLRRWCVGLLVTTGLTHLVFPAFYGYLTTHQPGSGWVVALLGIRNGALVLLLVGAWLQAWREVGRGQCGSELDRQPPGPTWRADRTLR